MYIYIAMHQHGGEGQARKKERGCEREQDAGVRKERVVVTQG